MSSNPSQLSYLDSTSNGILGDIKTSFSGHETFPFRYGWLKKGIDSFEKLGVAAFTSSNATTELGVGKNMVQSIRHWCLAAQLIKQNPASDKRNPEWLVSEVGKLILGAKGFDPYLEDVVTLWILHWKLATNLQRSTTWLWAYNFLRKPEFTREEFTSLLLEWASKFSKVSENSLKRDTDCFFQTYASNNAKDKVREDSFDCPLVELNLLTGLSGLNAYQFNLGAKPTLPSEIFAAALVNYLNEFEDEDGLTSSRDSQLSRQSTFDFKHLAHEPRSPGMVFKLDRDSIVEYLDDLEEITDGAFVFDETAGLKQVYKRKDMKWTEILRKYYDASF